MSVPRPNVRAITDDVALIHRLATGCTGKLILTSFGEDTVTGRKLPPRIHHFAIGNVAGMTARALGLADEAHRNVYVALSTMSDELTEGKKGGEANIAAVFGIVADFDSHDDPLASDWANRLPLPPTMVIETSSTPAPSFQCRYIFDHPLSRDEAKAIARAMQIASGCDTCSVDMAHVWRLGGGLNWPNQLKVEKYGRPPEPQPVRVIAPFDEARLVSKEAIAAAFALRADGGVAAEPSPTARDLRPARRVALAELDQWRVPELLKIIIQLGRDPNNPKRQDNSRSAWLFSAVRGLMRCGVPAATVMAIITDPAFKISESVLDKGQAAMDYARRQISRASAEAADADLEAFNAQHAVVENYGNRTVVVTFDAEGRFSYRSFEDFKRSNDHRKVRVDGGGGKTKLLGRGSAFLDNPHRRQFKSVVFLPGKDAEDGVLNLYRGPSIAPAAGDCSMFIEFVRTIICDGADEIAEWLLDHIAHLLQRPWETPEVCVVLRGPQGIGKNVFVEWLGEIISDYFIVVTNPKHLVGSFNRHLMDKLVVFADEAFFGNETRYAGILKNLVTQSQMAVEPKGVDVFMAKKYFRLFMASNEDFVVPADLDDRRMLVLDVSDTRAKDHDYFAALRGEWDAGGREAFYDRMLTRDLTGFNHRRRPETAALADQKIESLVGAERVVFEMLSSGRAPVPVSQPGAFFLVTEALRMEYARQGARVHARALADEIEIIAMHKGSKREMADGRQARGFWIPDLDDCRRAWSEAKKLPVTWPEDDGGWIDSFRGEVI